MKFQVSIILIAIFLSSCSSFGRLGDLTIVSNRNYDKTKDYKLLASNVEVKVRNRNDDVLEKAIDKLTTKYNGEFLMNVKFYMNSTGKIFKVSGDVYGISQVKESSESESKFTVGDKVFFKSGALTMKGKIIGIKNQEAVVEVENLFGTTNKSVKLEKLTKIN